MKNRLNIIIPLFALLVLIGAQVYVISELYKYKNIEFIRNYQDEIVIALETMHSHIGAGLLNSVSSAYGPIASEIVYTTPTYMLGQDSVKQKIFNHFREFVAMKEELTPFLRKYLAGQGMDSVISSFFVINRLALRDFSLEYPVYNKEAGSVQGIIHQRINDGAAYIYTFDERHDYFEAEISYYIDFSNRKRIIMAEMATVLSLLAFTIIIVLFVYIRTLRNMLRQKKLSELKSEFISNMTHELKTPLSTIAVASASLSLDQVAGDKTKSKELSAVINRQNKLLNQMIDQVLDASAFERSGFKVKPEPVMIKPFLHDIADSFSINKNNISFCVTENYLIDDNFIYDLDKFQFTRVFNNLFTNAVKYCHTTPEIGIKAAILPAKLLIEISDNGIGIAKEEQRKVFYKFYRGNNSLSKKVKGLGLGLFFVKTIVEAHGGGVSLESIEGEGSKFIIELPIYE